MLVCEGCFTFSNKILTSNKTIFFCHKASFSNVCLPVKCLNLYWVYKLYIWDAHFSLADFLTLYCLDFNKELLGLIDKLPFQRSQTRSSIFLFKFCASLGFVLCIQVLFCRVLFALCPQYWNMRPPCSCCSCRAWSMAEEREHELLLPCPLVPCCLYFHGQGRHCQSWKWIFSAWHHLSKMNFWICETSCGNSRREIVCRTPDDNNEGASCHCWRAGGAG